MLNAFKVKPFDLEPVFVSWPDAPVFQGNAKDDPAEWIKQIRAGCKERKVPREYWHVVGMHYLGKKPKQRLDDLGKVMMEMTGNKHCWDWKKFKIAMHNLGWGPNLSGPKPKNGSKQAAPPVPPKSSRSSSGNSIRPISERPVPKKQGSWWVMGRSDKDKDKLEPAVQAVVLAKTKNPDDMPSAAAEAGAVTLMSNAPAWLVNACQALDYLTSEHPRVMSAMSAILLTIGAIPSLPAISAGAGGAFLASGACQAAGAVVMAVGQSLRAVQQGQVQATQGRGAVAS